MDSLGKRDRAAWWAQRTAAAILIAGIGVVALGSYRTGLMPAGPAETTTTTKDTKETKTTGKGPESTERHEVTTALKETTFERALGPPGLLFLRLSLVLLVAFFSGAAVQRVLLGEFSLKVGPIELPPLPPLQEEALQKVPADLVARFGAAEAASEVEPDLTATPPVIESSIGGSRIASLLSLFGGEGGADYAVVNLEEGQSWLTTRLFLLSILLKRMRGLRALVFVETREGVKGRFVGVAAPDYVRWRLARAYPWLEPALARAYAAVDDLAIRSDGGALEPNAAGQLVEKFMDQPAIQTHLYDEAPGWIRLAPGTREHATWINRTLLEHLLDLAPARASVIDAGDLTEDQRTVAVLACEGPFVALVDDQSRFRTLIDRRRLLDSVGRRVAAKADGAA